MSKIPQPLKRNKEALASSADAKRRKQNENSVAPSSSTLRGASSTSSLSVRGAGTSRVAPPPRAALPSRTATSNAAPPPRAGPPPPRPRIAVPSRVPTQPKVAPPPRAAPPSKAAPPSRAAPPPRAVPSSRAAPATWTSGLRRAGVPASTAKARAMGASSADQPFRQLSPRSRMWAKRAVEPFEKRLNELKAERDVLLGRVNQYPTIEATIAGVRQETADVRRQLDEKKAELERKAVAQEQLNEQVREARRECNTIMAMEQLEREKIVETREKIAILKRKAEENVKKLRDGEQQRRQLHNLVLDLKGNIRVMCRVRPPMSADNVVRLNFGHDHETLSLYRPLKEVQERAVRGGRPLSSTEECNSFKFDHVFGPGASQQAVFKEVSDLIQSVVDGYNVTIFAYGQTGSGKTFTVFGLPQSDEQGVGMVPRSVRLLFTEKQRLGGMQCDLKFSVSCYELYCEKVYDLLGENSSVALDVSVARSSVQIKGLRVVQVEEPDVALQLFKRAANRRHQAPTQRNERSSRGHCVFSIHVGSPRGESSLNLVDLAGSESGTVSSERATERKHINLSLSTLKLVLETLGQRKTRKKNASQTASTACPSSNDFYFNWRNSMLTTLLRDSLGGQAKVLMFVNVPPEESYLSETLNSLRFATKVNNVHIGRAHKLDD